ncbi:MAG: hypothetical protein IPK27_01435 [Rhodanobacteraceae bacterium]|nr:hypothetical protein [Rhodanobacteraceae bacterium]
MGSCSFGGRWISDEAAILIGAAALALVLAPVIVGMIVGWSTRREQARRWRRALLGGAWVLGAYLALGGLWFTQQYLKQQRAMQAARAMQASIDPLYGVQPGGWGAALAGLDLARHDRPARTAIAYETVNLLRTAPPPNADDWLAIARFADELRAESPGIAGQIDGIAAFARHGANDFDAALADCRDDLYCARELESLLAVHDQALVATAAKAEATLRAKPLDAATRAAFERELERRRRAPHGSDQVNVELAFDRAAPGQLAHALEACGVVLPASQPLSGGALACPSRLFEALDEHGVARLCADSPLDDADRATLDRLRVALDDSRPAARLAAQLDRLAADCAAGRER